MLRGQTSRFTGGRNPTIKSLKIVTPCGFLNSTTHAPISQRTPLMPSELFDLNSHLDRWFHWAEIQECFWPGSGGRSHTINPGLASIRNSAGIYCVAWEPINALPKPNEKKVQYIGQTKNFKTRMSQFANSAGIFWDDRYDGHSAGWRWPQGKTEKMMIAFFPLYEAEAEHMRTGRLFWYEALAIHSYYLEHGNTLPPLNVVRPLVEIELS